jgi:hypothetical protein
MIWQKNVPEVKWAGSEQVEAQHSLFRSSHPHVVATPSTNIPLLSYQREYQQTLKTRKSLQRKVFPFSGPQDVQNHTQREVFWTLHALLHHHLGFRTLLQQLLRLFEKNYYY